MSAKTADCLDHFAEEHDTETGFVEAVNRLGVLGFNPYTDAILPQTIGTPIHYLQDGEMWCARRSALGANVWLSPSSIHSPGSFYESVSAADGFEVINKRVFNWLRSGPFADENKLHDGLTWGIVRLFGSRFKDDRTIYARNLKAIEGIGPKLASKAVKQLRQYPSYPDSITELSP